MNVILWIVQILLALAFLAAGLMKLSRPREELAKPMPWTEDFSDGTGKLIGAAETLAAAGLLAPALTGIASVLTPLAAAGLALMMLLAIGVHVRRSEPQGIAVAAVLLALAAFVAWGRFGPYAFRYQPWGLRMERLSAG